MCSPPCGQRKTAYSLIPCWWYHDKSHWPKSQWRFSPMGPVSLWDLQGWYMDKRKSAYISRSGIRFPNQRQIQDPHGWVLMYEEFPVQLKDIDLLTHQQNPICSKLEKEHRWITKDHRFSAPLLQRIYYCLSGLELILELQSHYWHPESRSQMKATGTS